MVPGDTPVRIPLDEPIVATPGLLLLHVPPGATSLYSEVSPTQAVAGPRTGPGTGLTVTIVLSEQPVPVIV